MANNPIKIKDNSVCRYCGTFKGLSVDHIIPKARGGENKRENCQVLCKHCNGRKGSHTEIEIATIFRDIKKHGVTYKWETRYKNWMEWIEVMRKENGLSPLNW